VALLVTAQFTLQLTSRKLSASYRIAILGFPRSGKTTMITALFAYMFRRGINGTPVLPRGEETINRINANLEAWTLAFRSNRRPTRMFLPIVPRLGSSHLYSRSTTSSK